MSLSSVVNPVRWAFPRVLFALLLWLAIPVAAVLVALVAWWEGDDEMGARGG